jgi:hypothetical protein
MLIALTKSILSVLYLFISSFIFRHF